MAAKTMETGIETPVVLNRKGNRRGVVPGSQRTKFRTAEQVAAAKEKGKCRPEELSAEIETDKVDPLKGRREAVEWLERHGVPIPAAPTEFPGWECPEEAEKNVPYRLAMWDWSEKRKEVQKEIIARCQGAGETDIASLLWYTNTFVWQSNPERPGDEVGPFIVRDYQRRAAERTVGIVFKRREPGEAREDVLWEKSRELGATWWALIIGDKECRFHRSKKILAISHSEQAVDKPGDPDSLFWKLRFVNDRLPIYLQRDCKKRKLGMWYPHTHSAFTGAASSGRSGVGGRATLVLLDEFSKQREAKAIWGQTASTGPRLIIGTHYAPSGQFYDLTQSTDIPKVIMHWSEHPGMRRGLYQYHGLKPFPDDIEVLDKTYEFPPDYPFVRDGTPTGGPHPGLRSVWYDAECRRRKSARDVASHLDINPQGSASEFFDALIVRSLITRTSEPSWVGNLMHDAAGWPLKLIQDPSGIVKMWFRPVSDTEVPAGVYGSGVDTSTGTGAANSTLSIANSLNGEKVCEVATAHMLPAEFACLVVALCRLFKDAAEQAAMLAWEDTGGCGLTFGKVTMNLGFRRLFTPPLVSSRLAPKPGWKSTQPSKHALLQDYKYALFSKLFTNPSKTALEECGLYSYGEKAETVENATAREKDPSGARSNHGDRVIADALAWMVCKRLGAGKAAVPVHQQPPAVGSLEWRMLLNRPVRTDRRPLVKGWRR